MLALERLRRLSSDIKFEIENWAGSSNGPVPLFLTVIAQASQLNDVGKGGRIPPFGYREYMLLSRWIAIAGELGPSDLANLYNEISGEWYGRDRTHQIELPGSGSEDSG